MSLASKRSGVLGMSARILLKIFLCLVVSVIVVLSTIMLFQEVWLTWILEVILLAMLIAFLYQPLYERGFKDKSYYESKNLRPDRAYGLKSGLIASIPLYVMTILLLLMTIGLLPDMFFFYRILNPYFWPLISIIAPSSYAVDLAWYHFLILFLADSIVPVTCGLAYFLGLKRISVSNRVLYKKKTNGQK